MKTRIALILLLSLVACSRGGGRRGGGGGGTTGNAAIDATLPALFSSLRSNSSTIDASITTGTVVNPAALTSSTTLVPLGSNPNDGTAAAVVAEVKVEGGSSGLTITTRVTDSASQQPFLEVRQERAAPALSARVAPLGLAQLDPTGVGRAFILVRLETTATESSTFDNTVESGATLVRFGDVSPVPSGSASRSLTVDRDLLVEYEVARVGSALTAKVAALRNATSANAWPRPGLPAAQVEHDFAVLAVGGRAFDQSEDVVIPVGPDPKPAGGVAADAPVSKTVDISGGVPGVLPLSEVAESISPPLVGARTTSFNHSAQLSGIEVGDGRVQADRRIRVTTWSQEDPTTSGGIRHSADTALGELWSIEDAIYLPAKARRTTALIIFR